MKTIRYNTFETNSSSTHAYTLNIPVKPSYKPIVESNKIDINVNHNDCENWAGRIGLLAHYLILSNCESQLKDLTAVIEEFAGFTVTFLNPEPDAVKSIIDEDLLSDYISDNFYEYTNDYGHGSVESFMETLDKILSTAGNTIAFIFSENSYNTETYIDG